MTDQNTEKPSKWWEFYLVRYLLGTMVGSFISYILFEHFICLCPQNIDLQLKLSSFLDLDKTYNQLFFLGVGFVFCYISSAPILVMHATRMKYKDKYIDNKYLFFSAIAIISMVVFFSLLKDNSKIIYGYIAIVTFVFIMTFQLVSLYRNIEKNTIISYKELIKNRESNEEYVESYKHLREHGNAFFIVVLEIVFGLILYQIETKEMLIGCILVWIIPGSFIWGFGNFLESELIKNK